MTLTMGLRRSLALDGGAEALVSEETRLSRHQFVDRVARLAAALRDLGMRDGDRVAMLAANGHRYVEFYFGVLWGGGVIVPINSRFALAEMIEQARDAEPVVLIVDDTFAAMGEELAKNVTSIAALVMAGNAVAINRAVKSIGYEDALSGAKPIADAMRKESDLACLFYTGGTTGRSKGVMLSHSNLWANAMATIAHLGLDENLVHLHSGPLFHLGAGARVYTTAVAGGKHVVVSRFTPQQALATIAREKVTVATFVPTMLAMLLELPDLESYDLSSLRLITYGASPMPEPVLQECLRRLPQVRFAQSYGMTELSPVATMLGAEHHMPGAPPGRLRSAGRPVYSAEVRVADTEDHELPRGEVGEIIVRGPIVMMGYWRKPELTAETLRNGWMHTGDSGYFDDDGFLFIADRIKDMIISGGENVYSIEVENAIASHPDVAECAVIGIPDPRWGEAVHAIVVARAGTGLTAEEIQRHCRTSIAGYKCPRSVDLRSEPLPQSSVNKIDKAALRAPFWSGRTRQVN
ncbi:long-chain-fatty-acid--CoA ligase [Bradyrhizobium sediminis]|uniref:3-methylmercaptopropionyl-CoA ligase n=1 Tax=Bradyrhizobium sediminis TaxID=2840469 RepID=A0A975NL63_9BRAD|nr:long-chain-fatty-acid--CoA ligase [Bradyrhizobium sediminis]QWG17208.1 long-chain-fatty-acid--CoA ligase [Bradyrhizobium sediminis]